jgi:NADH dehydrogenase FAD-containing subunit
MAATNGKSKDGKKKVLVVGAGAAGMSIAVASNIVVNRLGRNVVCSSFVATP